MVSYHRLFTRKANLVWSMLFIWNTGFSQAVSTAQYDYDSNQLTLAFDITVDLTSIDFRKIVLQDTQQSVPLDHAVNLATAETGDNLAANLLYEGILDSTVDQYYGDNNYQFRFWGTDIALVMAAEALDPDNLNLALAAGAFTDINGNLNEAHDVPVSVSLPTQYPELLNARYEASTNSLQLVFDEPVQFDRLAEDRSINAGPGDQYLQPHLGTNDPGEDRNGNGVLDMERNVRPENIGFSDGSGTGMTLEGLTAALMTEDNDTMELILTPFDAMRLESWLNPSNNLQIHLSPWAFSNADYQPNTETSMSVAVTADPVNFIPDSVVYNISKNELSLFFHNLAEYGRSIRITNPSPVYGNFSFSNGVSDYTILGVQGNPAIISGTDNTGFKFRLPIHDQNVVEGMLEAGDLALSIAGYSIYDNLGNGNEPVENLPIQIRSTTNSSEQPLNLISATYNTDTQILTLTWDLALGVGYYLEQPFQAGTLENPPNSWQNLAGFMLFDANTGTTESLGMGAPFYTGPRQQTYFKLSPQTAHFLQTHPDPESLFIAVEPRIFNSFLYQNGNNATTIDDAIGVNILTDITAPIVTDAKLDLVDHTITVSTDEPIEMAELQADDFSVNDLTLAGTISFEGLDGYGERFTIHLTSDIFNALMTQPEEQVLHPQLTIPDGLLVNAAGLASGADTLLISTGRFFWTHSFEAFPPDAYEQFGQLLLIGNDVDIYVAEDVWETQVTAENLDAIQTAFESQAPNDDSQGIKAVVDDYYGGIYDTDGNGKVIIFLTDIADEYDRGTNNTNHNFFTGGYVALSDTADVDPYSNHGDIIYLDVDPQSVGSPPYAEWDETILHALTYQYALLSAQERRPDQEDWIHYGVALKLQEKAVGNVKFFGDGANPRITAGNELSYIAPSLLKSRDDLYNVYNFFTYLTEKYSDPDDPLAVIKQIAQSNSVGIAAVDAAIAQFAPGVTTAAAFSNYGTACFLDMVQSVDDADSLYSGMYNFDALALNAPPSGKNAHNIPWDSMNGFGAPFHYSNIKPWSFRYYLCRAYFINLEGEIVVVSPDLSADDTLYFGGMPNHDFKIKKIILRSGFLSPISSEFEVVDVPYDATTGLGEIPVTTDSNFVFGDTLPNPETGAQLLVLVMSKTNDAPTNDHQIDMTLSNQQLTGLPPSSVQAVATNGGINIHWEPGSTLGGFIPESYNLFRQADGDPTVTLIADHLTGTTYFDENPAVNHDYWYGAQANFVDGSQSDTTFIFGPVPWGGTTVGLRTAITNYGSIGDPNFMATGRPSMDFPAYSNNNYLYDGGLWVGTELNGEAAVTTYFYNPDREWEPRNANGDTPRPMKSFFVPDQPNVPIVNFFDDLEPVTESNHVPIGLSVIETYEPGGLITDPETNEETLASWGMITYNIINTGLNGDLNDVYVALWMDFDVASIDPSNLSIDDLVDYNSDLMLSYMYDWDDPASQENDIGEFGLAAGYVGTALLKSPTETVSAHAWWNWENDPKTDDDRYQYMNGTHPAMQGYNFLPNPWNLGYPAFDYRTLQTTGPFDIPSYDTVTVQFLLVAGDGQEELFALTQLARDLYYTDIADEDDGVTPATFALEQNYPNPFNAATTIRYSLPEASHVKITIFNILGQQVTVLRNAQQPAGRYQLTWNPQQAASGLYFIRLEAGNYSKTMKSILLK